MQEQRLWALVADGSQARILKNIGLEAEFESIELGTEKQRVGEIMSDRAGRTMASVGGRRSQMELKSDPVRDNERAFATTLAQMLDKYRASDEMDALIVVAAPQALGDLRHAFSDQLRKKVTHEIDKDLTNLPQKKLLEAIVKIKSEK